MIPRTDLPPTARPGRAPLVPPIPEQRKPRIEAFPDLTIEFPQTGETDRDCYSTVYFDHDLNTWLGYTAVPRESKK